jgi:anthranilate phosphoribosyltransferase
MMSGEATPSQIGGFLMALRVRGETVTRSSAPSPPCAPRCCGRGAGRRHRHRRHRRRFVGTYNISTLAAIIVAGCGVPVAKHGNRGAVLALRRGRRAGALGVKIDARSERCRRCIGSRRRLHVRAAHHPAMRHVGPTRVELGTRTIFNLLGPLSNPAGVTGSWSAFLRNGWMPMAEGAEDARLAANLPGSCTAPTASTRSPRPARPSCRSLEDGKIRSFDHAPRMSGFAPGQAEDRCGRRRPEQNAAALRAVLDGAEKRLSRHRAAFNAAAALVVAGKADDAARRHALGRRALDSGAPRQKLDALVAVRTREETTMTDILRRSKPTSARRSRPPRPRSRLPRSKALARLRRRRAASMSARQAKHDAGEFGADRRDQEGEPVQGADPRRISIRRAGQGL